MEDLELSRRLHCLGRLTLLEATSTASARRFTEHGTMQMVVFMQYLRLLYCAGMPPGAIAARYARGPLPDRPTHYRRSPSEEHYHGAPVD